MKEVPVLLRPRIEAGAIVFDFPGESGVTYRVERRAAGVDAGWEIVETRTGDGGGNDRGGADELPDGMVADTGGMTRQSDLPRWKAGP